MINVFIKIEVLSITCSKNRGNP